MARHVFLSPPKLVLMRGLCTGFKDHGILPLINKIGLEDYNELRDARDFIDAEKRIFRGEIFQLKRSGLSELKYCT
jgi:hypothetical protein